MNSPSKVGIDIGQNFGQSQALGLMDSLPDIRLAAAAASATMMTDSRQFNIDARGSSLSRSDIYAVVRQAMDEEARRGDMRGRLGLSGA